MPDTDISIDNIIIDLNSYEKRVLRLLGNKNISVHKNIRLETIKEELPNKYGKHIDKAVKSLIAKGIVFPYRNKNYGLSPLGIKVSHQLKKEFRDERYGDLRILLLM